MTLRRVLAVAAVVVCMLQARATESAEELTVRAYIGAYNAHDLDAVLKLIHPDFVWLNLEGDEVEVEIRGKDAIKTMLEGYLKSLPSARSEIESISALGPWVTVRERTRWTAKDGAPRSQAAMSVYEVRDGQLRRVWYYPAVK